MRCTLQMTNPWIEAAGETGRPTRVYEQGPVRYTDTLPPPELAADIVCFWSLRIDPAAGAHPQHILPDLTVDVIRVDGGPAFVMGPPTAALHLPLRPGIEIEGARLRAVAAYRVLDCSPAELLNRMVPLHEVLCAPLELTEQPSLRSVHALVLQLLRRSAADEGTTGDTTVRSAIHWLGTNWQGSVDDLSRQVNWSGRKLHRQFVEAVGMGPKLVQRIVRVQRTLQLLRARTANSALSDLALECGFADQAHMTREVAHFTDYTPSRLRSLAHRAELAADFC